MEGQTECAYDSSYTIVHCIWGVSACTGHMGMRGAAVFLSRRPGINQPSPQLNAWQTHCVGSDLLSLRVISSTEGLVVEQGPLAPAIPGPDLSQHHFCLLYTSDAADDPEIV